jgi:hypothetical protein
MTSRKREIVGGLCIAIVVAIGIWHANYPELLGRQLSLNSAGTSRNPAPETRVRQVYWSADGSMLLSLARGNHSAKRNLFWHGIGEKCFQMPIDAGDAPITSAALAPDGRHALVGTGDGRLAWIGLESAEVVLLAVLPAASFFTATAVAGDGRLLVAGTDTGSIHLYDSTHFDSTILASTSISGVTQVSFSRDGIHLVCAQNNGRIGLWNMATGKPVQEFEGHRDTVTGAFLLPGNMQIISSGLDDTVRIWDVAYGREMWHGEFNLQGVTTLAVSADGTIAAWGGRKGRIYLWDLELVRKALEIETSASVISHLTFSADGQSLAVAEDDELIHFYDARAGTELEGIRVEI